MSDDTQLTATAMEELVAKAIDTAMISFSGRIMKAVDEKLSEALTPSRNPTTEADKTEKDTILPTPPLSSGNGTLPYKGVGLPEGGALVDPALWSGVQKVASGATGGITSNAVTMSQGNGTTISPSTPLTSVLKVSSSEQTSEAIIVGMNSPPVPKKLAEKKWKGEYIQLDKLLPSNLGAPELTLVDLLRKNQEKQGCSKRIKTIQQWVICFNAYTSILAIKQPKRIRNLLAYSSMVTKASADYQGTPWLAYDIHFRQVAAVTKQTDWSQVNSSLWTQYFANAKIATAQDSGLTMVPVHQPDERGTEESSNSGYRPEKQPKKDTKWKPYPKEQPICLRWNRAGCRDANCSYRHICLDCHSP